ncbi:glutamate--cysteine ligase [Aliikangiella marina]|uniref:Glutamate--cysteine ligase n=1 Tax=Aliikangiella marina TaxID=1712262 RepID=A0A545TED0_9GAMM|nr:glutamate--cysteine ligase [Aliikangiella marina]TQV75578.1 glutamate--cysteine ligase [Aliikangiella marina]
MSILDLPDLEEVKSLSHHFTGIKRGIEKESLRILPNGYLSPDAHPASLGSTLTNAFITTDYSEALPEFITTASSDRLKPLKDLEEIHQFVYQNIDNEILWAMSMPCVMGQEEDIPIARYGSSNSGQMKEIYRLGLGYRYGRFMQTIAGVHYNFSLPQSFWTALHEKEQSQLALQDFISEKYMGLIRNYLRHSWVIPLFFGASPALCESFLKNKNIDLDELVPGTRYGPYATSLRMSDLGYQNKVQSRLNISYNSLDEYIAGLESAISTADPYYSEIGVKKDGEYIQLNDSILQIENEFYSSIRPKRVSQSGERPTKALRNRGVEYIEVRALDLNPFSPIGIDQSQIAFMDTFLLACLFSKSDPLYQRETGEYQENFRCVVRKGRHPDVCLTHRNQCVPMQDIASNLLSQLKPFAELLDSAYDTQDHADILQQLEDQVGDLNTTYSGKIVSEIERRKDGFFQYAMGLSKSHKEYFTKRPLDGERLAFYENEAQDSHKRQAEIEQADSISFEAFLANYYR